MAPAEPMMPVDLASPGPEHHPVGHWRPSGSYSSPSEDGIDMGASRSSVRSAGTNASKGSSLRGKLGLLGVARRTLGIALLLLTVFLWTVSNFLASYIFSDHTYDKPFFLVYLNTSIFAWSLIPMIISYVRTHGVSGLRSRTIELYHEVRNGGPSPAYKTVGGGDEDTAIGERLLVDDQGSLEALDLPIPEEKLSLRETAWLSLEFCMLWFVANYFASACLEYTSVGSVTILTSTSSVWTLVFCALMKVEGFTVRKLMGVLASLAGVILISSVDLSGSSDDNRGNFPHKSQTQIAIGDGMALFSAVVYGMYVTVMKRSVGNEDRVDMPLFFGLVGLFNVLFLWPGFFILHFTGIEPFQMPPSGMIWAIVMINSISSFVSDIAWAYAMLLTTPLVVTVGLSLTIPLSLVGEMIQYDQYASWIYWVGAAVVFLSFVFINHESQEEEEPKNQRSEPQTADSAVV